MERSTSRAPTKPGRRWLFVVAALACAVLTGCAHIEFDAGKGLAYYEPVPHLLVAQGADCSITATLLMLPGPKKYLRLAEGYGASDLKVSLSDGMITEVGQTVDNRVPETLSSLASLATLKGATVAPQGCAGAAATLYPIVDGKPAGRGVPLGPK